MRIRELTIDDYEEITQLWSRAGLPFKPKGRDRREAIAAQMRANPDFFVGAQEGDRLVGIAVLSCDMRKGWINRLVVDPVHRRRGIAESLLAESEKILRRHGVRILCSLIDDSNIASKRLFKKCGYVEHRDIVYFSKRDSEDV
jgi:ribosomal protein S18 acetylase RimI-like enzyme